MSPGRIQEIVAAAGLPSTHDSVSAVAALTGLFTDRKRMAKLLGGLPEESLDVLRRPGETAQAPPTAVAALR